MIKRYQLKRFNFTSDSQEVVTKMFYQTFLFLCSKNTLVLGRWWESILKLLEIFRFPAKVFLNFVPQKEMIWND